MKVKMCKRYIYIEMVASLNENPTKRKTGTKKKHTTLNTNKMPIEYRYR